MTLEASQISKVKEIALLQLKIIDPKSLNEPIFLDLLKEYSVVIQKALSLKMKAVAAERYSEETDREKKAALERRAVNLFDQAVNIRLNAWRELAQVSNLAGYAATAEAIAKQKEDKANQAFAELLAEEEKGKAKNKKRKKRQNRVKQSQQTAIQTHPKKAVAKNNRNHRQSQVIQSRTIPIIDENHIRIVFYSNLLCLPKCFGFNPRVTRWLTANENDIRGYGSSYAALSKPEIEAEKAKHALFGIERLLAGPYRFIYSFISSEGKGCGMFAQLTLYGETKEGVIYFGISDNKVIYHKYFEERDLSVLNEEVFSPKEYEKNDEGIDKSLCNDIIHLEKITEANGCITFTYSENYQVKILPIRDDLLKNHIAIKTDEVTIFDRTS